jgi:hypothetical protein
MAAEEPTVKRSWITSTMMEKNLQNLEKEGFLPPQAQCSWRAAMGVQAPTPREGDIITLVSHIERGMSFPLFDFCSEVLAHYGV